MTKLTIRDVRVVPGDSAFLIDDGETAILYDSGFAFTGYGVADKVRAILGERSLDYIFLTHSHYDHALGAAYARRYWPRVKIVAGAYAAGIFAKPSARAVMRDLDRKFAVKCGVLHYEDLIDELRVDVPVKDGDVIHAGKMEFTVIDLPGHTKCSIGYYCPSEKLLLGCETLGVFNGVDEVVPSYLVGYQMTLHSIERATALDVEYILIPHFGLIQGEQAQFYLKRAKESAIATAEELTALLRRGGSREEAVACFRAKFYHGYVKEIYPEDAMELNTGITVSLLAREFGIESGERTEK